MPKTILVVANETLGGRSLLERIKEKAAGDELHVIVCVPRTNPRHGNVIFDDAVFDAAQVRIDLARKVLREEGISAIGEVGDPDPYSATMDAIAEYEPDEVLISTFPAASSGWLRRDLIERISDAAGIPVDHVVVDLDDYNKYVPFTTNVIWNLLSAYEWNPGAEGADNVNIPESGNGVPDTLDEVKWELDWLLKMQTANGSVLNRV